MPVGWNWKNSMSSAGMPRRRHDGDAVAGVGVGVGGDLPGAAVAAGGEDDRLAWKTWISPVEQLDRHHAADGVAVAISRSSTWNSSKKVTPCLMHCW